MAKMRNYILISMLAINFGGCVELYNPPEASTNHRYLVVNGFLNASDGSVNITLSHSLTLADDASPEMVSGARVAVENELGESFSLTEQSEGTYQLTALDIDMALRYRLTIETGSKDYASELVPVTQAPPLDSITWIKEDNAVTIFVHTHDPENNTRRYLWEFRETWMYNSAVPSHFIFENGAISMRGENIYTCWKTMPSTKIMIASSESLDRDVISEFPLTKIGFGSPKFRTRYSIQVLQYALTKDAYQYWQQLRDNVSETGGLFDAQPSRITGNFRSATDPKEPVLGFFSACAAQEARIYINSRDIPQIVFPDETDYSHCNVDTLLLADVPAFDGSKLLGTDVRLQPSDFLIGYLISTPECVDCRLTGGVNVKPQFWNE